MSEINVQLKDGPTVQVPGSATVEEVLKKLDRDLAKRALAAEVDGQEVDLARRFDSIPAPSGPEAQLKSLRNNASKLTPILPEKEGNENDKGLEVLRHSTAHLLAAAVLDLFPGTKLGIGPALLEDPRYGFFYDVI